MIVYDVIFHLQGKLPYSAGKQHVYTACMIYVHFLHVSGVFRFFFPQTLVNTGPSSESSETLRQPSQSPTSTIDIAIHMLRVNPHFWTNPDIILLYIVWVSNHETLCIPIMPGFILQVLKVNIHETNVTYPSYIVPTRSNKYLKWSQVSTSFFFSWRISPP